MTESIWVKTRTAKLGFTPGPTVWLKMSNSSITSLLALLSYRSSVLSNTFLKTFLSYLITHKFHCVVECESAKVTQSDLTSRIAFIIGTT